MLISVNGIYIGYTVRPNHMFSYTKNWFYWRNSSFKVVGPNDVKWYQCEWTDTNEIHYKSTSQQTFRKRLCV